MNYKNPAFIFARGGSKGVLNKNIKILNGKPLIAHSIDQALAVNGIDRVIVSTDSEEIAKIAIEHGAEIPFIRPKELALDSSPEWLSWKHVLEFLLSKEGQIPKVFVSVPTTSPLRASSDIQKCIEEFYKGDVESVITVTESSRSPYFNMVKLLEDEYVEIAIKPEKEISRRQDAPKLYDMTTVAYVVSSDFILKSNSIFDGRIRKVTIPEERALDIDTILDFQIAQSIMEK